MDSATPKLIPCTFKLPLSYNDGQPVAEERRNELLDLVYAEFGGWTIAGEERGAYRREDTGEKQVERLIKVSVAVPGIEGVNRLRDLVARIGGELGQERMYFEVSIDSTVELIKTKKGGGS
jgi:hypothetical protein